ncbi:uncharacterized protein BDW47DRAFT_99723 [Aspergillus candidus]|uniref:Uncharacterized protein n=1 Tax=Aspergillus candidus TaxID=41067 RepID=A0A2I2FKS3_ASPCN|nr:hypothetical protein BDW47DRAFT_99723 [Aspergillus candidus]PLB41223.1 hypothetical protein BDW47DRAFT_99723 [Aspergillus candidus]
MSSTAEWRHSCSFGASAVAVGQSGGRGLICTTMVDGLLLSNRGGVYCYFRRGLLRPSCPFFFLSFSWKLTC